MIDKKIILLILDGWGYREEKEHNAVWGANPVHFKSLLKKGRWTLLNASEESVGLPAGQMGNSEVGHTNIGAGRVVYQDFLKISLDIKNGKAAENENIISFLDEVKNSDGRLHLMGLLSDGGVHSHIDHIKGIASIAKARGIKDVFIHVFTDGRDTPPKSGKAFVADLTKWLEDNDAGRIADITGRYYAMDRDKRWDRVEKAWKVMRLGIGERSAESPLRAMEIAEETDEFIKPTLIEGTDGIIKDGDGVFMMNFRADRMRELARVMLEDDFQCFERGPKPKVKLFTLTEYDGSFGVPVAYPPEDLKDIFGETVAQMGLKQLRIAETEKYAHVTYFFNGGREEPFRNEIRALIASPREVATYDMKPEMSVYEVEAKFEELFRKGDIGAVIMNFANPDMVGHTGTEGAAVKACKAVDDCLGRVMKTADETGAVLLVTADHGNSELMWDHQNNQPHTAHTTNPVVLAIYNSPLRLKNKRGKLADIAPTMLNILGIEQPRAMTGESLIDRG